MEADSHQVPDQKQRQEISIRQDLMKVVKNVLLERTYVLY